MRAQELIDKFQKGREQPVSLLTTAEQSLIEALGPRSARELMQTPLGSSIKALASVIDQHHQSAGPVPDYHNIAHFKEAVIASSAICAAEFSGHPERARMVGLGVLSMIGHDFMHDGTTNSPDKSLEAISWAACEPHLKNAGLSSADQDIVHTLILKTDPSLLPENRERYKGTAPPGAMGRDVDRLCLACMEADTAGSLLPGIGNKMGDLLSSEWMNSGIEAGKTIGSWKARVGFLGFIATATEGSKHIGMEQARTAQIEAFKSIAQQMGLPDAGSAGAKLDEIAQQEGKPKALMIFAKALESISPELAQSAYPEICTRPLITMQSSLPGLSAKLSSFRQDRATATVETAPSQKRGFSV